MNEIKKTSGICEVPETELPSIQNDNDLWSELLCDGRDIILEPLPAVVEIVEGIVTEQAKLLVGCGSKCYKTYMAIDLGLSISHGHPFLGRQTARRRVLYVNLELKPVTFHRRLQIIACTKKIIIESGWFTHLPLRGRLGGLDSATIIDRIIRIAQKCEAGAVIIDPIYKLNVDGDENSVRDQTRLFNQLERITVEAQSTLILVDHFGKGNQSEKEPLDAIRGSSAKGGDVDAAMVLRRLETDNCFRVDMVHRELPPVEPFCIGWEYPLMQVQKNLDPTALKKEKGRRAGHDPIRLLAAIKDHLKENPISISSWAELVDIPRQTLRDYLPAMRRNGWIQTAGEGNQARQFITEKGLEAIGATLP